MRVPLRIAVLECDEPLTNTKAKYGGYGGVFEALLRASATALDVPYKINPDSDLQISKWDIVNKRYNSYDDTPWILKLVEFTKKIAAQDRVRLIGVCFGHQILGRALGAKVGPNDAGWEVAVHDVDLTEQGKKLLGLEKLRLQQMHRDIVHHYPPDVIPLGSSPRCEVQGMYSPRKFITVQGHPEFTEEIVIELLHTRKYMGAFPPGIYEEGMDSVAKENDGLAVGKSFLKFLLED
ncbi:glutamine amidotransferase [Coccidioides immitis RMSCC 3703]|uniref:Glutamine amidotransferase n=1 Tax=Coccidioides immitis RMSCC 3703 TaxID=454286 RepID=A0A0J8TQA1_COCIT|nr:glutamine amidotransferase [Coccidioides immitis RMSCC 3703]